jgi:hypothetical protein
LKREQLVDSGRFATKDKRKATSINDGSMVEKEALLKKRQHSRVVGVPAQFGQP